MSNVVPLFKESTREPIRGTGTLKEVMELYTDFAEKQGVDVGSTKFLYESATIMTLMQIAIGNREE